MSFCSYDTVKVVQIKDARLGALKIFLILTIVIYVSVYEMWGAGGYLASSPVVGVCRFSLHQPTLNNCDPSLPGCPNAFEPLNTLPYCQQYNISAKKYKGNVYPCEIYEAINAQIVSEKSIVTITRASTRNQSLVCNEKDLVCPNAYEDTSSEYKFYTAQSEAFTILLDHAVTASKICTDHNKKSYTCSAEASHYQGRLYSKNNDLCVQEHHKNNSFSNYRGTTEVDGAPCYIQPNRTDANLDFFSLDVLLKAAGISLDDCNGNIDEDKPCQTFRDSGVTVLLNIYWRDFFKFRGLVEPHYYYSPQIIAGSTFKQYIPYYDNYRQKRTLLNAHGVKVAVLLGGEFNQFNIVKFLVTLTTALGLLAVSTTIVDSLMLYVLPEKKRYQQAKYESTEEIQTFDGLGQLGVRREERSHQLGSPNVASSSEEEYTLAHEQLNEPLLPDAPLD